MAETHFSFRPGFELAGDQPAAVEGIVKALESGEQWVTLLGATGTGKTATMAAVAERLDRPVLVMAPNKTLAGQLASEFKEYFPKNAVEYFVSYYDYYQPEAYVPSSDTYIEKDATINDEIDRLRHSATAAVMTRRDALVVASVSCIYGLGTPEEYEKNMLYLHKGSESQSKLLEAQRLRMRTNYDLEMMREIGSCAGIENYSRHLDGRQPGERPYTLLDYFKKDFIVFMDESHITVPQVHGMYEGDRSR